MNITRLRRSTLCLGLFTALGLMANVGAQSWHGPYDIGDLRPIHLILLKSGRFLGFDQGTSPNNATAETSRAYLMDVNDTTLPPTITRTPVPFNVAGYGADSINLFCSAHFLLPDQAGTVLFAGGDRTIDGVANIAESGISIFRESGVPTYWKKIGAMGDPRWYPNMAMLPNGIILVQGGSIFFPGDLPRSSDLIAILPDHQVQNSNLPWEFTYATSTYYPLGFTDPQDANAFILVGAGPGAKRFDLVQGRYVGTVLNNAAVAAAVRSVYPAAAMIDGLMIKSGQYNLNGPDLDRGAATYIDFNLPPAQRAWMRSPVGPEAAAVDPEVGRTSHVMVILPNKELMVFGGHRHGSTDTSIPGYYHDDHRHRAPEGFKRDPGTGEWSWKRLAQAAAVDRGYHQTAALMPSGNILVTGGEPDDDPKIRTIEIFRPAYQDIPDKPTLAMAQHSTLYYGETFDPQIAVAEGRTIKNVSLITFPSVTHAQSFGHRLVSLSPKGSYWAAPSAPEMAPPGWYMLFVEDSAGAISVAKLVRVTDRWSRRFPTRATAQGAVMVGSARDLVMSDSGPRNSGRHLNKLTLTRRSGEGPVHLEIETELPPTVDPLQGLQVRLEHRKVGSGYVAAPILEVYDAVENKWRTLSGLSPLSQPTVHDGLQVRLLGIGSHSPSLIGPGVRRFRLTWPNVTSPTTLEIDELRVSGWQSNAE